MTTQGFTIAGIRRRRRNAPTGGIVLAILALCLRLAWPAPMPAMQQTDFATALGEHVLCLSSAPGDDHATVPPETPPVQPGGHADHGGLGCCLWQFGAAFLLPRIDPPVRQAFAARIPAVTAPAAIPPARTASPVQARAPPAVA